MASLSVKAPSFLPSVLKVGVGKKKSSSQAGLVMLADRSAEGRRFLKKGAPLFLHYCCLRTTLSFFFWAI